MTDQHESAPEKTTPAPVSTPLSRAEQREAMRAEKRARALRNNLQRRKQQQRGRDSEGGENTPNHTADD